jgi:hypothetical protein
LSSKKRLWSISGGKNGIFGEGDEIGYRHIDASCLAFAIFLRSVAGAKEG